MAECLGLCFASSLGKVFIIRLLSLYLSKLWLDFTFLLIKTFFESLEIHALITCFELMEVSYLNIFFVIKTFLPLILGYILKRLFCCKM